MMDETSPAQVPAAVRDGTERAIVVGSRGQDGSILFDRLAREGHFVLGIERDRIRCTHRTDVALVDILQPQEVERVIDTIYPDSVYYLAAHHHSSEADLARERTLFESSLAVNVTGLLNFLEAIRRRSPQTRLFYAASSRVFGGSGVRLADERTPLLPDCVYGATKAAGVECCRFFREKHDLFAATGILFNHESPRRRPEFVTQKIVQGALAIRAGRAAELVLGDLAAETDWGYAPDYVEAMIRIMGQSAGDDYIVATGKVHSVAEFAEVAFRKLGLDFRKFVREDPSLVGRQRAGLAGDATKLSSRTGWAPSVDFERMIEILVDAADAAGRCDSAKR